MYVGCVSLVMLGYPAFLLLQVVIVMCKFVGLIDTNYRPRQVTLLVLRPRTILLTSFRPTPSLLPLLKTSPKKRKKKKNRQQLPLNLPFFLSSLS